MDANFLRELSTVEDGMPLKRPVKWHGLPELPTLSSMRQTPQREEFLHNNARSRREVSSLSDYPPRGPVVARTPASSQTNIAMPLPSLQPEAPGMPRGSQSARAHYYSQSAPAPPEGARTRHPSNRSDAALLATNLAHQLASGLTFRQELDAHNAAFQEVTRQVSVHCSERGELLGRLQSFYTKSVAVTVKLAEKTVREQMEVQITSLQSQLLECRQQLKDARSEAGQGLAQPDKLMAGFEAMVREDQRDVLSSLMEESGHLLLSSHDGDALSAEEQAEVLDDVVFSHYGDTDSFRSVVAALAARQNTEDKQLLLKSVLGVASHDERFHIIFEALDYEQRKALITNAFSATVDSSKGPLIAELMQPMKKEQAHLTMAAAVSALESQSTTTQGEFMNAWVDLIEPVAQPPLVGGLLASMPNPAVIKSLVVGTKKWKHEDSGRLAQDLLLALPKGEMVIALTSFLDRLKPNDRRLVLSAVLEHTATKELPMLLPNVLSRSTMLNAMGSAAALADSDFLEVLASLVREMGAEIGGRYVGTLYRALPQPESRCACLSEIGSHPDTFGPEEILQLMDYFGQHSPSLLRRWMAGTAGKSAASGKSGKAGVRRESLFAGGGRRESFMERRASHAGGGGGSGSTRSQPLPRMSLGGGSAAGAGGESKPRLSLAMAGAAVMAQGRASRSKARMGSGKEDASALMSAEDLMKLIAEVFAKKIKLDAANDVKLKDRAALYKFLHDTINQTEGVVVVQQTMKGLRHYSLASEGPLQPRMHLIAQMLGLLESEAWPQLKVDFVLAFVCQALRADRDKRPAIAHPPDAGTEADKKSERRPSRSERRLSSMSTAGMSSQGDGKSKRMSRAREGSIAYGSGPPQPKGDDKKLVAEYFANPIVARDSSTVLKDALIRPGSMVQLSATGVAVEMLITDVRGRAKLHDSIELLTTTAPDGMGMEAMVPLDQLMKCVAQAWEEDAVDTETAAETAFEKIFEESDTDKDGLISMREFREIIEARSPSTDLDETMRLYDQGIEYSAEQLGEDTDAITKDAFTLVMEDCGLLPLPDAAFIDVSKLVREHTKELQEKEEEEAKQRGKTGRRSLWKSIHGSHKEVSKGSKLSAADAKLNDLPNITKKAGVASIIRKVLKENFLFRHLDDAMIERVVATFEPHPVKAGDAVITQGDKGDYFYVCESGMYDVFQDGKKVLTYTVQAEEPAAPSAAGAGERRGSFAGAKRRGSFSEDGRTRRGSFSGMRESSGKHPCFGELALMYSKPRAASVVATQQGQLWKLSRDGFRVIQLLRTTSVVDMTKVLRKVNVLEALRFDQLQILRDRMEERTFDPGEYVFRQGDPGDAFYLIARGSAQIIKESGKGDGDGEVLVELKQSAYFGERALLLDEPRAASVRASGETPLVTARISRAMFETELGSLQEMLDDNRRQREAAVNAQKQQLEAFGLYNAERDSFAVEAKLSTVPCGMTWLVKHIATNSLYTMREEGKALVRMNGESQRVLRELTLLKDLVAAKVQIPFLPTLLRAIQGPQSLCLLYKQRAACSLSELAAQHPGGVLGEKELMFTAACIARGLDVLHTEMSAIYRNLAPEKITVLEDGYVCLMDLRFAKQDDGSCLTLCGSPSYFAPETLRGDIQGFAVDWWAFGVLLFELATGDSPWGATDDDDMVLLKRISSHTSGALAVPQHVNPQLSALLNDLLEPDVEMRRGDSSVVVDAWFDDINWSRLLDEELPSPLVRLAQKSSDEAVQQAMLDDAELEPADWDALARPAAGAPAPAELTTVSEGDEGEADQDWDSFSFGGPHPGRSFSFASGGTSLTGTREHSFIQRVRDQRNSLEEEQDETD